MDDSKRIKLLIIEDAKDQLLLLRRMTIGMGYLVEDAATGEEGLQKAKQWLPDVILLDMNLPNMNGMEVLSKLKASKTTHNSLIIIVSADDNPDTIVRTLAKGASDYVRKPFNNAELSMRLGNLLNLRHSMNMVTVLSEKYQREKELISKYFSSDLIAGIIDGTISTEIGGEIKQVTSLICDLRGSTSLAEVVPPDELAVFLSDFFSDISDLIVGEGGSVNNFRGDGFLATFGVPVELENSALAAAKTAIKIQKHLDFYNQFKPAFLKEDLKMGVGIATGDVFVGNVGSVHRIDYTVLGDAVNLSARLESLTKVAKVDTLIDGKTRDMLGEVAKVRRARLDNIRGKIQKVQVFALDSLLES